MLKKIFSPYFFLLVATHTNGEDIKKHTKDDIEKWQRVATEFVEKEKGWKRGKFKISYCQFNRLIPVAIFEASHKTALEERIKDVQETGNYRRLGLYKNEIAVYVDINDLSTYELSKESYELLKNKYQIE